MTGPDSDALANRQLFASVPLLFLSFHKDGIPPGSEEVESTVAQLKGKGLVLENQITRGQELGVKQTRILIEADQPVTSTVVEACGERTGR